ncbi:MAG: DNA polymerase III subunit beta [Tannerella sp.]|jgi:DNA polymerase-3 subunit beta|nr:DNA polymerase III subunit beta [Tannerella sp.]
MAKFTISKNELFNQLKLAGKIISSKPANPIMSSFLFEVKHGKLYISAADILGRINLYSECITGDDVCVCIESSMIMNALKELPEQPVTIEINRDTLGIMVQYNGGKFEMIGQKPELFPVPKEITDPETFEISLSKFIEGINAVLFCAANDELHPSMNGVYIEITDEGINFIATDGSRMGIFKYATTGLSRQSFILPVKTATILKSILTNDESSILISSGSNNVSFKINDIEIISVLQEGRFPNYRAVIPVDNHINATVNTTSLKSATSRVGIFASQSSNLVVFDFKDEVIEASAKDLDYSTSAKEILNSIVYSGADISIGFKSTHIHEILSHITSENCLLLMSEPFRVTLIKPEEVSDGCEITYLQMPMTVN